MIVVGAAFGRSLGPGGGGLLADDPAGVFYYTFQHLYGYTP